MMNKSKELNAKVTLINEKLNFKGEVDGNLPISIDYISPLGDDSGYTSLELLLLSISSCVGTAVITILRKMHKKITGCEVKSHGIRREEHPTGFSLIELEINISTPDAVPDDIEKAIKLSEGICPVWAMLKGNVEIRIVYQLVRR